MKTAEMRYALAKKGWPRSEMDSEIIKIKKSAGGIAKDTGVPVRQITKMILENIKYVGSTTRP